MTPLPFTRNSAVAFFCALSVYFPVGVQLYSEALRGNPAVYQNNSSASRAQTSTKAKPAGQTKTQKLANPLNDLLDEAQRDIDQKQFEAAITPLQKVLAEQPDFAYGHFQLAYVYTALKKTKEARAEYERTATLDPKMSAAYVNLGMLLLDSREDVAAVVPLRKAVELLPEREPPALSPCGRAGSFRRSCRRG